MKTKQYSCDSTVTTNLTVNTLDLAVVVNNDTLSVGAVNGSYQWIDCSTGKSITGATLKNFTPIKSGIYAVIVTNVNCSDTSACTPISLSGIAKETSMLQLNVFPNPSAGTFTIRTTIAGSFTIINQLGQTVRSFELNNSNDHAVTISELSNGTYYIIGLNHNYLTRQKIVVVQ